MARVKIRSKIGQQGKHDEDTQTQYKTRHRYQGIDFLSFDISQSDFDITFQHGISPFCFGLKSFKQSRLYLINVKEAKKLTFGLFYSSYYLHPTKSLLTDGFKEN
jgi:hypothetical protein